MTTEAYRGCAVQGHQREAVRLEGERTFLFSVECHPCKASSQFVLVAEVSSCSQFSQHFQNDHQYHWLGPPFEGFGYLGILSHSEIAAA